MAIKKLLSSKQVKERTEKMLVEKINRVRAAGGSVLEFEQALEKLHNA